ncbi:MAG: polysaccharide deacetylase family protein [Rhodospirillaceae bacterium]|nr:polysaccharide deacetylase family protein [Rhodospirillaceae bacterium]
MMEHGRFAYSPIAKRAPLKMPGGARIAVWVTPNVEHFHYDKPAISLTPMTAALRPDVLNYAWRDYGARVGIWRLMEIFAKHGIPATAALNAECCAHYPQIVEAGTGLGWEWMAHGRSNSLLTTGVPEDEERKSIAAVLDTIAAATGKRPRGWLSPALTETDNTLDLLAEAGVAYVADWCNDDLPYRMRVRSGSMVAMPYTLEIGDIPIFLEQGGSGEDFYRTVIDQFDVLWHEGATMPRIMSMALHPFLIGHPFRAKHLERAFAYMKGRGEVWFATGSEILDWWLAAAPADA